MRVLGTRWLVVAAVLMAAGPFWAGAPAHGEHIEKVVGPSEPSRSFPADFMPLLPVDSQANSLASPWRDPRVGGWGGGTEACPGSPVARVPVIFVHGNAYDASFWRANETSDGSTTNVRSRMLAAGYCPDQIWAISYTGGPGYTTYNDVNVPDVAGFVKAVAAYTGAPEVDVVSHSLGVTLVRKVMQTDAVVADLVRRHVAIAGANHGTTSCRGSGTARVSHVCEETEPGSAWLAALNGGGETVAGVEHLVIYDGHPVGDNFFVGPDADSPRLAGACNHAMPLTFHLPLARGAAAVNTYVPFLREGILPACH